LGLKRTYSIKEQGVALVLLLAALLSLMPVIDNQASKNYESLFQRAFVTFALARTLNGVISAVQGTELALQPAGVGLTLTPGEILDPVNDLVERFSWVMLGATVSLGVQDVLMDVSAWWVIKLLAAVMAIWLLITYVSSSSSDKRKQVLTRVFLIALFLRFAVPLTLIANDAIYELFLEPRYLQSTEVVAAAGKEIEQIGQSTQAVEAPEEEGGFVSNVFGSLGDAVTRTKDALDLGDKVARIKDRAAEMIEHLIQLSVVFILQTGILPLVFLWLFLQLGKSLFRSKIT
jgi:hypothetical protein